MNTIIHCLFTMTIMAFLFLSPLSRSALTVAISALLDVFGVSGLVALAIVIAGVRHNLGPMGGERATESRSSSPSPSVLSVEESLLMPSSPCPSEEATSYPGHGRRTRPSYATFKPSKPKAWTPFTDTSFSSRGKAGWSTRTNNDSPKDHPHRSPPAPWIPAPPLAIDTKPSPPLAPQPSYFSSARCGLGLSAPLGNYDEPPAYQKGYLIQTISDCPRPNHGDSLLSHTYNHCPADFTETLPVVQPDIQDANSLFVSLDYYPECPSPHQLLDPDLPCSESDLSDLDDDLLFILGHQNSDDGYSSDDPMDVDPPELVEDEDAMDCSEPPEPMVMCKSPLPDDYVFECTYRIVEPKFIGLSLDDPPDLSEDSDAMIIDPQDPYAMVVC